MLEPLPVWDIDRHSRPAMYARNLMYAPRITLGDDGDPLDASGSHFFEIYRVLEPGKSEEGAMWVGRADVEREIKASWQRAKACGPH